MSNSLKEYHAERIAREAARRLEEMANVNGSRTNVITLVHCPFCGSNFCETKYLGGQWQESSAFESGWRGECSDCGALTRAFPTEVEAAKAWNTRSITAAAVMGYEAAMAEHTCRFKPLNGEDFEEQNSVRGVCSECSALMHGKDSYCPNCGARVEGVER